MQKFSKVYDSYPLAESAVRDLESAGVPTREISLVANRHVSDKYAELEGQSAAATGAEIGVAVGGGVGVLTGLGLLAIPGLGPVVAAGWLASAAVGALAGTAAGGLIGALVDAGTPESDAHVYSEAVRRGGTLVTVQTDQPSDKIDAILNNHRPIDPSTRRKEYEGDGWKEFDPKAPAYRPSQTEIDRMRQL
jgi:hypothetical protein